MTKTKSGNSPENKYTRKKKNVKKRSSTGNIRSRKKSASKTLKHYKSQNIAKSMVLEASRHAAEKLLSQSSSTASSSSMSHHNINNGTNKDEKGTKEVKNENSNRSRARKRSTKKRKKNAIQRPKRIPQILRHHRVQRYRGLQNSAQAPVNPEDDYTKQFYVDEVVMAKLPGFAYLPARVFLVTPTQVNVSFLNEDPDKHFQVPNPTENIRRFTKLLAASTLKRLKSSSVKRKRSKKHMKLKDAIRIGIDLIEEGDDFCYKCFHFGNLMMCEMCGRSAHPNCLGLPEAPKDEWHCEECALDLSKLQDTHPPHIHPKMAVLFDALESKSQSQRRRARNALDELEKFMEHKENLSGQPDGNLLYINYNKSKSVRYDPLQEICQHSYWRYHNLKPPTTNFQRIANGFIPLSSTRFESTQKETIGIIPSHRKTPREAQLDEDVDRLRQDSCTNPENIRAILNDPKIEMYLRSKPHLTNDEQLHQHYQTNVLPLSQPSSPINLNK